MGTGSLTRTKSFLRVVVGQNWVLMSRGTRAFLMVSDVPLAYGMVTVACVYWCDNQHSSMPAEVHTYYATGQGITLQLVQAGGIHYSLR